jgi:hypothetical protein
VAEVARQFADQARDNVDVAVGALDPVAKRSYEMADDLTEGRQIC